MSAVTPLIAVDQDTLTHSFEQEMKVGSKALSPDFSSVQEASGLK
jgi:hypothetical protein